jgi:hypothetical protein
MCDDALVLFCEMPELLNRMQIASKYTLKELQDMFNYIMNKIKQDNGPTQPGAAALFHFPEVFLKFKDEYMQAMIRTVLVENESEEEKIGNIDVYLGNMHVSPLSRLWNTNS